MKSIKQNEQTHGYAKHAIIKTILSHYKTKLEDLSIEELEEELYAEEETTKFGEIPFRSDYDGSSLLSMGLEQYQDSEHEVTPRPSDEEIKIAAEKLIKQARLEGFIITPKISANDKRMLSKWQRHENYSKRKSRDMPRHQQNTSPTIERKKRFMEDLESARRESTEEFTERRAR